MAIRGKGKGTGSLAGFMSGSLFKILSAVFAAVLWIILATGSRYLLMRIDQLSLFSSTEPFFQNAIDHIGGLLGYAGCFLTQFLYKPVIGSLIAAVLWYSTIILSRKAFKLDGGWEYLAFIPASALVAADMEIGYTMFDLKLRGWFFIPALGYLASLLAFQIYTRIENWKAAIFYTAAWTIVFFPVIGFYALLGTVAMAIASIRLDKEYGAVRTVCGLAAAAIVPPVWSQFYVTVKTSLSYFAILPDFPPYGKFLPMWIPYLVLFLFTVTAAALIPSAGIPAKRKPIGIPARLSIFAACIVFVWTFWYRDVNMPAEMMMEQALEDRDWKQIARIQSDMAHRHDASDARVFAARSAKLSGVTGSERDYVVENFADKFYAPSRHMVLYRNLALLRMGNACSTAFTYKDGGRIQKMPDLYPLMFQCGKQLYFNYGLLNYCYRWCMEQSVEYGFSVETLKYLIRSSLLSGNWNVAEKYIRQLESTLFHRKWATGQRKYLNNMELIAGSDEYRDIFPLICKSDRLDSDNGSIELFLQRYFKTDRTPDASPEFDDVALLWIMQTQDITSFWAQLINWINTHPSAKIPRHCQEAAILYGNLENNPIISSLPFDDEVTKSYEAFRQYASTHPVRNPAEMSYSYSRKFGNTFYYYYYFIRNLKTY